ncbi:MULTISPECIES: HAMP domain-containing sensor histidine kinase [Fusobacterium]|uniref:sensor histidine kinase n=1 Tax=Fusobacterium TaxID=848 RepID=UPI001476B15C|nr:MULTISPECIES: HAMP domain-containing sensor histidine kinase [Fusobacterium]NME35340.1 HAMP domain-containing histidine kinase [Fusobacterium sp. FSA-380-WT-3A]
MKKINLSIKTKITLWYTFFMVGIVSIILGILVEFTDMTLLSNQKNQLMEVVEEVVEDIEEKENFDFFDDGVFVIIYNKDGKYINGSIPHDFPINIPLKNGTVEKLENKFYYYDREIKLSTDETYWVRGVISDIEINNLTQKILIGAFIFLPFLVIISTYIGYFITKKAFYPVKKIQETAQNISENNELSLRIGLSDGKDEISKLANTIDDMLEKLEKSFLKEKQFTSDASHELRTPISVILAESEYILEHGESLEEARESMEVINRQVKKMSGLINQLLLFTRMDRENLKLNLEKIDILKILEELKKDNELEAKEKNISLKIENNLKNNFQNIDKILFIRAIQNIIQNGINYGKENGYIKIKLLENQEYFKIEFEDNGIGIKKENIEKIWNRFYQEDESRNNKGSMGLGLPMVKWIVEKHRGYVEVESIKGVGSTFKLFFKKI